MALAKNPKADWDLIQADYIHGYYCPQNKVIVYPTQRQLAEKYDVGEGQIALRSRRQNWVIKREAYREMMSQQRMIEFGKERIYRMSVSMGETVRRMEDINQIVDDKLEMNSDEEMRVDDLLKIQKIVAENHKLAKDVFGIEKSFEELHNKAVEKIKQDVAKGREISGDEVNDIIKMLKAKTIETVAEEVE